MSVMRCGLFGKLLLVQLTLMVLPSSVECSRTELNHVVERVFSRQKRFVLFPKGSNLKFTGSVSKGLLSAFPKGITFSVEQACYYPVPTSRQDVYPKRFRPRTTTTQAPKTTTEPTYVWIPGTDWRFKATPVKKPTPVKLHQRIDDYGQSHAPAYVDPLKWKQWSKYGQRYENWTPAHPNYEKYAEPGKWSKWTTVSPNWIKYGKRWHRSIQSLQEDAKLDENDYYDPDIAPVESVAYPDLEYVTDSLHYHGHRDRRQLYEQLGAFSKLFGLDTKSCILRAICQSRKVLLPPGYSMLQDIVRLIFTLPTISGVEDEYSRIMRLNTEDCDRQFLQHCKVDLIAWMLGGKWN